MVLSVLLTAKVLAERSSRYQQDLMKESDRRLHLLSELLQGIKLIKLYAWERFFVEGIEAVRARQLELLTKTQVIAALTRSVTFFSPLLVSLVTFAVCTLVSRRSVDTATLFTAVLLFNTLREPLNKLSEASNALIKSKISEDRLSRSATISFAQDAMGTRACD
jgi:ABC-type bacteriocin/lantibiotic exporter with double-glycine peptidase domain